MFYFTNSPEPEDWEEYTGDVIEDEDYEAIEQAMAIKANPVILANDLIMGYYNKLQDNYGGHDAYCSVLEADTVEEAWKKLEEGYLFQYESIKDFASSWCVLKMYEDMKEIKEFNNRGTYV